MDAPNVLESSAFVAATVAVVGFLCISLFYASGESAQVVRHLVWYCLLPYAAVILLSKRDKNRAEAAEDAA